MKNVYGFLAALGLAFSASAVSAVPVTVGPLAGIESWGFAGDPGNLSATLDFGTALGCPGCDVTIDQVGWDLILETVSPSWFEEATIGISDMGGNELLTLYPGAGDAFGTSSCAGDPGCGVYTQALSAIAPAVFSGGLLTFEFYETDFDDIANGADAFYLEGELFFNAEATAVPEPGALMLFGLGIIGMAVARRRKA